MTSHKLILFLLYSTKGKFTKLYISIIVSRLFRKIRLKIDYGCCNKTSKMTLGLQNGTNHNVFWYETRPYDHSLDSANARKEFLKVDLNDWTTQVSFLSLFLKSFQQLTLSLFRSHTLLESLFLSVSLPFCLRLYFCFLWHTITLFLSLSLSHTHTQAHEDILLLFLALQHLRTLLLVQCAGLVTTTSRGKHRIFPLQRFSRLHSSSR